VAFAAHLYAECEGAIVHLHMLFHCGEVWVAIGAGLGEEVFDVDGVAHATCISGINYCNVGGVYVQLLWICVTF